MAQISQPILLKFLETKNAMLFGKSMEIREAIKDWLAYIPQSFPHYTQHTIEHSDEIILQISKLIFTDDDPSRPVVHLSAIEAYILVAAAYLHDAGMVVSDKEKTEIIQSGEWISWTSENEIGAKRWEAIKELRNGGEPTNPDLRNFIADVQTRFLIAEFVRRKHHIRAGTIMIQYQPWLGRFAFDEPLLLNAISNICIAHGLDKYELEDNERYPDRCDIMGESVNVRFMAILLRLGDLLDMRSDRACPLLLNAASPLPSDSLAHWTKYQRIKNRLTAPDKIEILAECEYQEEHRFLQDWCQWIVNEVANARELIARCSRHALWIPPLANLQGSHPTITIRPSITAKYIPNEWSFKLDPDVVYERLIKDLYANKHAFVRELLQNAFDATRCKMYDDLNSLGIEPPEYPTQVEEEKRNNYPINISLETRLLENDLSGEVEERQFIVIEDFGIGMDKFIVEHYLLQVGHSFYTTEEFRRNYRFVGTSRFGLGFLSVFAISDYVTIETYKPTSERKDGAIRLLLTGPKNYLLTEKCDRQVSGTRIEIRLQRKLEAGQLTKIVSNWCKRVEFPIIVNEFNQNTIITAEKPDLFIQEVPLISDENSKFVVKSISINLPGIYGEFYIFAYINNGIEHWDQYNRIRRTYLENEPRAIVPDVPDTLISLHGIAINSSSRAYSPGLSIRLDYRGNIIKPTLARDLTGESAEIGLADPHILAYFEKILIDHLTSHPRAIDKKDGWKYKQHLSTTFGFLQAFWKSMPKTIRIIKKGLPQLLSIDEVNKISIITTYYSSDPHKKITQPKNNAFSIMADDINALSDLSSSYIFSDREPENVQAGGEDIYVISWGIREKQNQEKPSLYESTPVSFVGLPNMYIGVDIHQTTSSSYSPHILLNLNHPFVQWFQDLSENFHNGYYEIITEQTIQRLAKLIIDAIKYPSIDAKKLVSYINKWKEIPSMPSNLYPPDIKDDDFYNQFKFLSVKSDKPKQSLHKTKGEFTGKSKKRLENRKM